MCVDVRARASKLIFMSQMYLSMKALRALVHVCPCVPVCEYKAQKHIPWTSRRKRIL